MHELFSALIAALVTGFGLRLMLGSGLAGLAQDHANDRSMHVGAVPRIGGMGIAIGVMAALLLAGPSAWPEAIRPLAAAVALVFAVSLIDDLRGLSALPRLLAHLVCAAGLCWCWDLPAVWIPVATLGIAWGANLYNFMDGADGLAGAMAVFGYGALGVAAWAADAPAIGAICAAVTGAALGFLTLNWHPARVFLGDAGSVPLGFGAAALALHGTLAGLWPAALPAIAFLPFITDASLTLLRRALRGARLSEPHREHLYQRLALAGHGHRWVAMRACMLMFASGLAALSTLYVSPAAQWAVFAAALFAHVGGWLALDRSLRARENQSTRR